MSENEGERVESVTEPPQDETVEPVTEPPQEKDRWPYEGMPFALLPN